MAKIAYIRVSSEGQHTDRQDAMFAEGYDRIFTEKISGKTTDRPQLQAMLDYVREGDTVVCESYSRLARNVKDLLEIIDKLDRKGVCFVSLKENVDTSRPEGRLMMNIFASLAQFEIEQKAVRQAEGIAEAKKKGVYKGRKPIAFDLDKMKVEVSAVRNGVQTHEQAMRHLGLKPNTYYRRVKQLGI